MSSARWAWDWLRSRPQILINGNKRWNRLELSEALALPEADAVDPALASASGDANDAEKTKGKKSKKALTTRPRIHPAEDLVWQTLTRHGVDYKRVPALEWACLQGVASARAEGILQSDLRRLVNQDKRSLPKRTDSLARKGYIAKRTVVVQKMKTSRLWLIDFAPPLVEVETCGLDLTPETLSRDLEPVPWHQRWTGNNIDMDALGRTVVGVVKAFHVIRYADMRLKMGVSGKRWQMKTLAKNCQRLVDVGVLKYTAASFPGSRKVFKDCLKFVRDPSAEEWDKFLATGKKTSLYSDPTRHREPKPNALALYGKSGEDGQGSGAARAKLKRIFSGWTPEKPLAQIVFEVIRSAGSEGASNPQVSVATVGYQHRRYLSSYLTKVAETQQPPNLKKFQVVSKLVRTGKTSAYMFSAPGTTAQAARSQINEEGELADGHVSADGPSDLTSASAYGFGAARPKAFSAGQDFSLADMSRVARKSKPSSKRKLLPRIRPEHLAAAELALEAAAEQEAAIADQENQPAELEGGSQSLKRPFDKITNDFDAEPSAAEPTGAQEQVPSSTAPAVGGAPKVPTTEDLILNVRYNGIVGKLQVHCPDRNLTFLRSGRGLKKPLIIPVDDNLDEPAIRDVPGSDEKSLVLATGAKDETPAWTYVFIFDDEGQENAALIQQEIVNMKLPDYEEPAVRAAKQEPAAGQELAAASEAITVDVSASTRGRGRGRGGSRGGGRARGKKGQALGAGAKPYICELCGGAWKNDLGLKYHLEKAQVPCNPSFDPAVLLERSRKRRKPSPAPLSVANSEAGDEDGSGRTRKSKRKNDKKGPLLHFKVRTAMRSAQDPAQKFRGLDISDGGKMEDSANWVSDRPKRIFKSAASQPPVDQESRPEVLVSTGKNTFTGGYSHGFGQGTFSNVDFRPSPPARGTRFPESRPQVDNSALQNAPAVIDEHATDMVLGQEEPEALPASLPTAPATPSRSRPSDESPAPSGAFSKNTPSRAPFEDFTLRSTIRSPLPNQYQAVSSGEPAVDQPELQQSEYPDLPSQQWQPQAEQEVEAEPALLRNEQRPFKPFARSSNYDRMTSDSKRRTAQAFDIITYLLDNNGGVFPGDKALFYALTKVFLKQFPKQMPPTWKNCTSAVKALETRKVAAVHTHMLKTERGRLQTCTLLIRIGVDPNGIIPTRMKQEMRESYPGIFIPPAFSPTQEELALLQELDRKGTEREAKPNANGQKFRSRRKIEEIEVFNAPYYTQSAPLVGARRDPLWIRESERLYDDGFAIRKRSAADDSPAGRSQKRARTGPYGSHGFDTYDEIPVDPKILGDPMSPTRHGQRDGPSVLEAIKAYSLLPAKLGPRGRRRLSFPYKPLAKLPPDLGRVRNPGLASLPGSFFGDAGGATTLQFISPEVLILDPNTNLEDEAEGAEDCQSQSQSSSRESTEDILDETGAEEGIEEAVEEPKKFKFACPSVLEQSSKGSWPDHSLGFFEHYESSFTLKGWMPSLTWLLTQNLPRSAGEMAEKQKLEKIRLRDWVDREYARFCSLVNQCAAWEQSPPGTAVMMGASVAPGFAFINVSPTESRAPSRAITLGWSDETQYNLETLPYEDLEDDDYGDVIYVEDGLERAAKDGEPSPKKRRAQKAAGVQVRRMQGRPPKLKLAAIKTMREHTAYPKTAEEFMQNDKEELDLSSENVRLAAFIVVTTLLGGVDRVVDWGLMLRLMPDQT
jgi:transcription factor C subunit 3